MYLDELTSHITLENTDLECKARLDRKNTIGWLKTVAGFANASGGDFFIGVEDKTGKLIGFDRREADNERNYFNNQINDHLVPRPAMKIVFIPYFAGKTKRYVIHISIADSEIKPVILKAGGIPSIFMRREGFTNGATYEEIIQMSVRSKSAQYDALFTDNIYRADDFKDLQEFSEEHTDGKRITEKTLASVGFFNDEKLLSNAAVLFRDGYDGKKTAVQCSLFSGFHRGSERIITINRFHGNLTNTIRFIHDFVRQRMNHSVIKRGDSRTDIDAYPERALFEGIINAIAHRDYYLDGTQIQVDMFRDRLEISSPGGFYGRTAIGKTYDLSHIISRRRNTVICEILVRCKVMEAAGTGFDKIIEEYAGADEAHRPYIDSSSDHFMLVLPDLTYENGLFESASPELQFIPPENGTRHDEAVLSVCYVKPLKTSEIAAQVGVSDSTYLRKQILERLVLAGYLVKTKEGRSACYKTNRDIVFHTDPGGNAP